MDFNGSFVTVLVLFLLVVALALWICYEQKGHHQQSDDGSTTPLEEELTNETTTSETPVY